jgi:hypothetical protein
MCVNRRPNDDVYRVSEPRIRVEALQALDGGQWAPRSS